MEPTRIGSGAARTPVSPRIIVVGGEDLARKAIRGGRLQPVRADSCYEAAAELLSAGADAIVLDLELMARQHVGLLALARHAGAKVFVAGRLPKDMGSDELSGVMLLGEEELPAAIDGFSAPAPEGERPAQAPATEPEQSVRPDEAPPLSRDEPGAGQAEEAFSPENRQAEPGSRAAESAGPADSPANRDRQVPLRPSELLTPEELSALLEDEP